MLNPVSNTSSLSTVTISSSIFWFTTLCLFLLFHSSHAQTNNNNATTDSSEVRALNSLFMKWGTKAEESTGVWNTSGEPCSGAAIDGSQLEDPNNNPIIKCDCNYVNGTTCHITQLRVYGLSKQGVIPEEIAAFTHLTYLKIDKNLFKGPLPAFIANLTKLQLLSISTNAFSGVIPKELGLLSDLYLLSLGSNNFSGTLPPELGNLVKLEQMYLNSLKVGGEIPSTFAKLQNMQILWASDSPFTGKIPDFIGNWTSLKSLRFQGNSFEGPIPNSFSNLINMETMRINDLSNVSSSLDFIKNMKKLADLNLRNAMISGSIPSDNALSQSLQTLDLSFNILTGQVPIALFSLSNLTHLFLGNNSLSGPLPVQKSDSLKFIDLSYNQLSGKFPQWVRNDPSAIFQVNLVANNFIFDSSNISTLPRLHCLQRNFPCNRGAPRYANFSVNCGGPEKATSDGIVYEAENSTQGLAAYEVVSTQKWAISNVGMNSDTNDPKFLLSTQAQTLRTSTSDLYQSTRLSPGSLRYYGLGLENGNYSVTLKFAETGFTEPNAINSWKTLGRRVFNIYIQGKLEIKDFDISKEAGGVERAVEKVFDANVTENYLEIHLFWAGKGTCCIPQKGSYGPSISAVSVVSKFTPTVPGTPLEIATKKSRKGTIVGATVAAGAASITLIIAIVIYIKLKWFVVNEDKDLLGVGPTFTYASLRNATDNFSAANKLGEGGYGPVYKGLLSDGRQIAVKQLSVASRQGNDQFLAEIATISAVQHRNLVKLYGCCIEGNRKLLVYEYLQNKSLDQALFGHGELYLDWTTRFGICLGTAKGLAYLHEESMPRIVHRDVKTSNILLDVALNPKISDFGLARLYDDEKTHISTRVAGTIGYIAPEYAMRGHLSEKADVFGFGVVSLEILCGRSNTGKIYLLEWAWNLYENNRSLELVDPTLEKFDEIEATRLVGVALLCTQAVPTRRPPMSRVVAMLSGDAEVTSLTSKSCYLTDWSFEDTSNSFPVLSLPSERSCQYDYSATLSQEYTQELSGLPDLINLQDLPRKGR